MDELEAKQRLYLTLSALVTAALVVAVILFRIPTVVADPAAAVAIAAVLAGAWSLRA